LVETDQESAVVPDFDALSGHAQGQRGYLSLSMRFGAFEEACQAARWLHQCGDTDTRSIGSLSLARLALMAGDAGTALALLSSLKSEFNGTTPSEPAMLEVLGLIGEAMIMLGRKVEAFAVYERLEREATAQGRRQAAASSLAAQGRLLLGVRDLRRARRLFSRLAGLATEFANAGALRQAYEGLSACSWESGRTGKAMAELDKASDLARRMAAWEDEVALAIIRADRQMALDNFDAAQATLVGARELTHQNHLAEAGFRVDLKEAELYLRIRRPIAAGELARRVHDAAIRSGLDEYVRLAGAILQHTEAAAVSHASSR
jgi:hypothetical protein